MKVLVTGCNGFVGSHLVNRFAEVPGFELVVTSRTMPHVVPRNAIPEILDITNRQQIMYCMARYTPDVVVHCAAMASVDVCEKHKEQAWRVNVEGTAEFLRQAERWNAHFVFVSTDFVFSGRDLSNVESDLPNPVSFYGVTKHQAEQDIIQSTTAWTIVRPVLIYGNNTPLMRGNVFSWILGELKRGASVELVHDQVRTPTYVEDLVWGLVQIVLNRSTGIYPLGGAEAISIYAFGLRLAHYFQLSAGGITPVSSETLPGANLRPRRTVFENQKARRLLNYQPTALETSFQHLKECLTD